jgi:hypothetical protein
MRRIRRRLLAPVAAGLVTTAMAVTAVAAGGPALGAAAGRGPAANTVAGPKLKLIASLPSITLPHHGKTVYLDPDIWLAALGAPFQVDAVRASYTRPVQAFEIVNGHRRLLPSWVLDGWGGLRDFIELQVRRPDGKSVASRTLNFCPNTYAAERADPASATTSPYAFICREQDPFPLSAVWGIARGWEANPTDILGTIPGPGRSPGFKLARGKYRVTESITPRFARLFGIPAKDSSSTVTVHVGGTPTCSPACRPAAARRSRRATTPVPSAPASVPLLSQAPRDALPDLVPLPSWGITTSHVQKTSQDFLNFGATVWVGGRSPLDVEGFRTPGSTVMKAYQYYWHDGHVVGRTRAGTMGWDSQKGHHHWHFEQFARYVLLTANKKVAVRSEKVGFCIAATDPVNVALPGAEWNAPFGLSGECGTPTANWVAENMPIGWGDTYDNSKAGQAFNITHLPDGTYYIEIIANPDHLLHEVTRSNDISLRKVIITGPAGHRQVRVPAWHGIDPEK